MYRRLAPYIRIGEEFRLKPFARRAPDLTPVATQPAVRPPEGAGDELNGPTGEEVRRMRPDRENQPVLVDLNTADSATLISVSGIGPATVRSIMEYRARLGGFADVEQLAEVRGVTEQNYERILPQIFVDPAVIKKININFAPAKDLAQHPYIRAAALRKLLNQRQLKGGWRTPDELEKDDIFTTEELVKLSPYLVFN
jgi:competence ComEA-like helix-hairpin-helix protein